jgi:uncharacterized membrane protein
MVALGGIAVGVVVAAAAVTTALLVMERPEIHHETVLGVGPWMVVAGLLHVLAAVGSYPPVLRPIVAFPIGPLLVFLLCTVVWVIVRQFATVRNVVPRSGRYLAASGAGTLVVLGAVLFVLTAPTPDELLWLVTTPVIAAVVAGVSVLALGIFDPTGLSQTRWVGWLVAFGFSALGTAVAVGIDVFGRSTTTAVDPLVTVGAALPTANVSVAWPLVLIGGILGFFAVSGLARIVERETSLGLMLAVTLTAATLTPAVALLATVTLR